MGNEQGKETEGGGTKTPKDIEIEDDDDSDDIPFEQEDEVPDPPLPKKSKGGGSKLPKARSGSIKKPGGIAIQKVGGNTDEEAKRTKRYCKEYGLLPLPTKAFIDLRRAIETDQAEQLQTLMAKYRLTPASRPYAPLTFSRLERNHNTILHYVIMFCATECFAALQNAKEWVTAPWNDHTLQETFAMDNRVHLTPQTMIITMLSQSKEALPHSFEEEMKTSESKKTIIPGAMIAMAELSNLDKERTPEALFALIKRSFDTFTHLRAVRTNQDILDDRQGQARQSDEHNGYVDGKISTKDVDKVRAMLERRGYSGSDLKSMRTATTEP